MENKIDIVLLSTADWDNPFWTNKQHVALELTRLGHRVLYIDSLGLRRPSLSKRDFSRIFKRALKAIYPPKERRKNLWVWSPIMLPWNSNPLIRKVNNIILSRLLTFWRWRLGFSNDMLWTYNPLTSTLLDLNTFKKKIYHCVDEIKAQPGMPIKVLEQSERALVENVDLVFVTSRELESTRKKWNDNVYYFSNVADYTHFSKALDPDLSLPQDISNIQGPILGFIGAISGYKIDFELLEYIATVRPDWTIVLIGEVGEGDPWTDIATLKKYPNILLLGAKEYEILPSYLKLFDVALLPNRINEYTDSMFPMKFFEYLSAGKSVISVDLKALREFSAVVAIASSKEDFVAKIESVLNGDTVSLEERLALASQFTYETRTKKMFEIINAEAK